jgi:hypothetical protein
MTVRPGAPTPSAGYGGDPALGWLAEGSLKTRVTYARARDSLIGTLQFGGPGQ